MASSFPGAIDNFTDPLANSSLASPSHAGQHSDLNDAVEKIETYMGLVKVIPTSVSSAGGTAATLSATGTVTVGTGNTSVTINNAWSSLYQNYLVIMRYVVSSAANPALYVTLGGTATGYYGVTAYWAYDASGDGTAKRNNGTEWNWGYFGANNFSAAWSVMNPNVANRTAYTGGFAGDLYNGTTSGMLANNTQYTAITFAPSTGSITGGTIRVYGYRD